MQAMREWATIVRSDTNEIVKQWQVDNRNEAIDVFNCTRSQEIAVAKKYSLKAMPLKLIVTTNGFAS